MTPVPPGLPRELWAKVCSARVHRDSALFHGRLVCGYRPTCKGHLGFFWRSYTSKTLPPALGTMGVSPGGRLRISPTLMVYVANPERAVAIAQPLLERYPQLSFSVALSLERSLGRDESLWPYPEEERRERLERVESELTAANFRGLTLQLEDAWGDAAGLPRLATGE